MIAHTFPGNERSLCFPLACFCLATVSFLISLTAADACGGATNHGSDDSDDDTYDESELDGENSDSDPDGSDV